MPFVSNPKVFRGSDVLDVPKSGHMGEVGGVRECPFPETVHEEHGMPSHSIPGSSLPFGGVRLVQPASPAGFLRKRYGPARSTRTEPTEYPAPNEQISPVSPG